MLIIMPLMQILVFGYVVNYDIKNVRVAMLDQCRRRGKAASSMTHSEEAGSF